MWGTTSRFGDSLDKAGQKKWVNESWNGIILTIFNDIEISVPQNISRLSRFNGWEDIKQDLIKLAKLLGLGKVKVLSVRTVNWANDEFFPAAKSDFNKDWLKEFFYKKRWTG